jgi:hypothetical protein
LGYRGERARLHCQVGSNSGRSGQSRPTPQSLLDRIWQTITNDRKLRWSVVQRGFWVHGVDNLRDYLRSVERFTMDGRAELIRCPTLLTKAEGDPLTAYAQAFFDALRCSKDLIRFTSAEGASGHCEMQNRSLLNRRILDWLDVVLRHR